ncbi:MAG: class I SAM-dependent methyltransferase [SAR324 cluster bacterium]|nr:class I SAM-dependent methyltransferase [SAR324 cluster bacterium]MBL7034113.1 class I SAM-dependent methyltransferase [SAR324 cluster bacterium]
MDQNIKFWDRIAKRYSMRPVADEDAYQKKLQTSQQYFQPEMEVLEFGCGTGTTAIIHSSFVKHIQAIDISSKMLEIAQSKVDAANIKNITLQQSSIDDFKVANETYDVVLGLSILHLLADKEQVLAKVHKMLKPGGVFVTNTVCIGDKLKFFKYIAPIGKFLGLLPLVSIFTTEELKDSLTGAGFEIDYQWRKGKDISVFIVAKKNE